MAVGAAWPEPEVADGGVGEEGGGGGGGGCWAAGAVWSGLGVGGEVGFGWGSGQDWWWEVGGVGCGVGREWEGWGFGRAGEGRVVVGLVGQGG